MSLPRSVCGTVAALIYVGFAIWVIHGERIATGGGWISLRGMGAALVTAPVSLVAEWLGFKLDYRSNAQMGAAVLGTALLIYLLTAGIAKLVLLVVSQISKH
jgi:hypothetical protein